MTRAGNITVNLPMVVHHADLLVQGVTQGGTVVEAFRTSDGADLWTLSSSTAQSGAHISGTYGSYRDRLHISVRLTIVSAFNVDSQQMVCVAALPSGGVFSGLALT